MEKHSWFSLHLLDQSQLFYGQFYQRTQVRNSYRQSSLKKLQQILTATFSSILGSRHPFCTGNCFLRQFICILCQLSSKTCKKCSGGDLSHRPFGQGTQIDIANVKYITHGLLLWWCWRFHSNGYWYRYVFKTALKYRHSKSVSSYIIQFFLFSSTSLPFISLRICCSTLFNFSF
jgi:hypothetical protein